jgi:hypothetical protein
MAGRYIEVIGLSFWLPDPDDVSQLASAFGAIENNLDETQQQLQALRSPESWANWSGRAAGAFASQLSTVPGQINQAHEAYATVTAALSTYSAGLYPVRGAILSLATEVEEAETTLQNETAELNHARQTGDHASVTYWTSRVQVATENVNSLGARLAYLHGELTDLAEACARKINQAQHDDMQGRVLGDIRHDLADVGDALRDAGDVAWHLTDDTFVQPFTKLLPALEDYLEHPDLLTAGDLLERVGDVIGVIALVAGIVLLTVSTAGVGDVALGALGTAGEAAEGFEGVAEGLADYGFAAHINAFLANTGAVLSHENGSSWIDVSNSALSVASDEAGDLIKDPASSAMFGIGSGLEASTFNDELNYLKASSQVADVPSGLERAADSVQGLQGLPVTTAASPQSASVLQPAMGLSSPATVSIQRVSIGQEVGIQ